MTKFVDGIKSLFSGPNTAAQQQAVQDEREQQSIALQRQQQQVQNDQSQQDKNLGAVAGVPRGRRLLLAATGENGVSSTLG